MKSYEIITKTKFNSKYRWKKTIVWSHSIPWDHMKSSLKYNWKKAQRRAVTPAIVICILVLLLLLHDSSKLQSTTELSSRTGPNGNLQNRSQLVNTGQSRSRQDHFKNVIYFLILKARGVSELGERAALASLVEDIESTFPERQRLQPFFLYQAREINATCILACVSQDEGY
jgi:hypothetical protein